MQNLVLVDLAARLALDLPLNLIYLFESLFVKLVIKFSSVCLMRLVILVFVLCTSVVSGCHSSVCLGLKSALHACLGPVLVLIGPASTFYVILTSSTLAEPLGNGSLRKVLLISGRLGWCAEFH